MQQSFSWLVSTVLRAERLHSQVEWTIHLKQTKKNYTITFQFNCDPLQNFSISALWNSCLHYPIVSVIHPFLCFANNTSLLVFSFHVRRSLQKLPSFKTASCLNADKRHMFIKIQTADKLELLHFRLTSIESLSFCSPCSADSFHYLHYTWALNCSTL